MRPLSMATLSACALLFTACGSGDDSPDTAVAPSQTEAAPTTATETEPQAAAEPEPQAEPEAKAESTETPRVRIKDFEYHPPTVKLEKGTTVRWVNRDSSNHTVTFEDENLGNVSQGQAVRRTFQDGGSFSYICQYHPSMKGRVVVR